MHEFDHASPRDDAGIRPKLFVASGSWEAFRRVALIIGPIKTPPPRNDGEVPPIAGTKCFDEENFRLAQQRSVSDSIAILRRLFPGALLCMTCCRIIATTAAGHAASKLTPEQIENYVCYGCRFDSDPARSAEVTARFAASKAAAAAARVRPPVHRDLPRRQASERNG